jgi:tetratricopeptide (TPR) repeat protein
VSGATPDPADLEQALADTEANLARLADATSSRDRVELSALLLDRAFTLQALGRLEEAEAAYADLPARFDAAPEAAIQRDVVRALQQRRYLLHPQGVVGADLPRPTVEQIRADLDRVDELERDGRYTELIELLGDIIRPWGHAPPADAAELVAYATVLAAQTAVRAGPNVAAALQACEEVVEHYGGSTDPGVRAMVVWGLVTKGYVYACARRYGEAAASCARAIEYAGADDDPRVRSSADDAREQLERWRTAGAEADA